MPVELIGSARLFDGVPYAYDCGATLRDVLKTTVYVASGDRGDLVAAWSEVASAFRDHDAPSTLLGVAMLGYPDQLVEIEAIVAGPAA